MDFTYEVSRSLAACEGALLVVDASQGIEAQTLANVYLAMNQDLKLIPVLNKIDLPARRAGTRRRRTRARDRLRPRRDASIASAKEGIGVAEILEAIVAAHPARRRATPKAPLQALIFDSKYDAYKGVVAHVRVFDGAHDGPQTPPPDADRGRRSSRSSSAPSARDAAAARRSTCGEVGYVATGLKDVADCRVGDTITLDERPAAEALPGYRQAKPMVFAGIYPTDSRPVPGAPRSARAARPERRLARLRA